MAHNPRAPQGPQGSNDPAGSTQMFRAFVEEGEPMQQPAPRAGWSTGKKAGVVAGVVLVLVFAFLSIPGQPWTIF